MYKRKFYREKDLDSKNDISFGRDFFIIGVGLALTLLGFFLFGTVSGLGLKVDLPRKIRVLIGDDGRVLDLKDTKVAAESVQGYVQIAIILGVAAFIIFVSTFIILRWIKNENSPPTNEKSPPSLFKR